MGVYQVRSRKFRPKEFAEFRRPIRTHGSWPAPESVRFEPNYPDAVNSLLISAANIVLSLGKPVRAHNSNVVPAPGELVDSGPDALNRPAKRVRRSICECNVKNLQGAAANRCTEETLFPASELYILFRMSDGSS